MPIGATDATVLHGLFSATTHATMDGTQFAASYVKHHLPYFTPAEVERLSDRQRGKLSMTQEEKVRQQACGFIEAVGAKIGLYVVPELILRVGFLLMHAYAAQGRQ